MKAILTDLKKAAQTRDFRILRRYTNSTKLLFDTCGGTDAELRTMPFDEFAKVLGNISVNAVLIVNSEPDIEPNEWIEDIARTATFEVYGWTRGDPYQRFIFYLPEGAQRWMLRGTCYSPTPALSLANHVNFQDNWEYFDTKFRQFSRQGKCEEAEKFLQQIERDFPRLRESHYNSLQTSWLLQIARCFENKNPTKSLALYHSIQEKSSRGQFDDFYVTMRLNWLKGDRSWVHPNLDALVTGVRSALQSKDVEKLRSFASKSDFAAPAPTLFDETVASHFRKTFRESTLAIGALQSRKNMKLMPVEFRGTDYPYWTFIFREIEDGWQWTGYFQSNKANMNME